MGCRAKESIKRMFTEHLRKTGMARAARPATLHCIYRWASAALGRRVMREQDGMNARRAARRLVMFDTSMKQCACVLPVLQLMVSDQVDDGACADGGQRVAS